MKCSKAQSNPLQILATEAVSPDLRTCVFFHALSPTQVYFSSMKLARSVAFAFGVQNRMHCHIVNPMPRPILLRLSSLGTQDRAQMRLDQGLQKNSSSVR